ncbi:MAG TPA: tetratricopeptide repeat protein, partial [Candidatus Coatesbacteria bacterium]|nr:tetratricopeptide repeat protein [Candidatus Coatesbacteria bacterium]
VAEIIRTEIAAGEGFRVIERSRLQDVMAEQAFTTSGAVSEHDAVQLGALLGADFIGVGSVSRLGDTYTISGRIVMVATGEVIAAKTESCAREDRLVELAKGMDEEARGVLVSRPLAYGNPEAVELYKRGVAALEARDPESALALFLESIELAPNHPRVFLAAIGLARRLERIPLAIQLARKYLERFPDGPNAHEIRVALAELREAGGE